MAQGDTKKQTRPRKRVKGSPKWGDIVLQVVAGLVLLYIFLPIFVIMLFSFNKPTGKFNYTLAGLHAEQLGATRSSTRR